MKTNVRLWSYLAQFLAWEMLQTKVAEKIRDHVVCLLTPYLADHAVYKIMWNDTVEPDSPQIKV